ncbi:hypothetical protein VNO80_16328 [Phaseolus coccineus]|uniref:Uncharacterized protein n=1 Tax=Phaseolus coccineus TaxID=3886 RepID=A0AAN9R2L5_PHACN
MANMAMPPSLWSSRNSPTFRRKLHLQVLLQNLSISHTHTYVMLIMGGLLEESKVALQIKKFLTQLEIFATNELQKEFPEIGIYIERGKNEKNSKKNKKQPRQRLLNDLKGPTITRPKTLPFLTCMCLPFFSHFSLQSPPNS